MTNKQLIEALADNSNITKVKAEEVIKDLADIIQDEVVAGNKVHITSFGTFWPGKRAARRGVDPQTGAEIHIPEMAMPAFRAGDGFKRAARALR